MSKLRLSASSIKDYLECPKRFWYRTNKKEKAVVNEHVVFGNIVHGAVEKFKDVQEAVDWSVKEWAIRMTPEFEFAEIKKLPSPPKSFSRMLGNYYNKIIPELPDDELSETEMFFEVPWHKGVIIIGKMDRVIGQNVYDWKTGSRLPSKYILQDFQFYLYEWAYRNIYGKNPKVYYGHLNTGDLIPIEMNDSMRADTTKTVAHVIRNLNDESYPRVTGYQCSNCFYRDYCYGEMEVGIGLEY